MSIDFASIHGTAGVNIPSIFRASRLAISPLTRERVRLQVPQLCASLSVIYILVHELNEIGLQTGILSGDILVGMYFL
jgi:hypothetical protein